MNLITEPEPKPEPAPEQEPGYIRCIKPAEYSDWTVRVAPNLEINNKYYFLFIVCVNVL